MESERNINYYPRMFYTVRSSEHVIDFFRKVLFRFCPSWSLQSFKFRSNTEIIKEKRAVDPSQKSAEKGQKEPNFQEKEN